MPGFANLIAGATAMLVALAVASGALGQGNPTANTGVGRGTSGSGQDAAGGAAQTAQQGANTTDGTTTGVSGPDVPSAGPPGVIEPPGPPTPSLCDDWRGTPAYETCLGKVLVEQ